MSAPKWDMLGGLAVDVALQLLGCYLIRELDGRRLVGKIVETEAYDQTDAASHSFYGSNGRAAVTFGPAGCLYVHASRHHFLCDITVSPVGHGSSVLIRAIEPIEGRDIMIQNRHGVNGSNLANGPAKACQALGIDKSFNGHDLRTAPLTLELHTPLPANQIVQTTRIGITHAKDVPWRFYLKGSPFISH